MKTRSIALTCAWRPKQAPWQSILSWDFPSPAGCDGRHSTRLLFAPSRIHPVTAPSEADETKRAYLAITPVA